MKDIKPPVDFPANYFLLITIAVLILLAGLLFLARFLLKRRRAGKSRVDLEPPKPADQIALEALRTLQEKNLPGQGMIKQYYSELSDIIRCYIEGRFDIKAPEMTTEEFLVYLRESNILSGQHKNLLREFLNLCDIVKFAKYGPTPSEIEDSFDEGRKLVEETKLVAEIA